MPAVTLEKLTKVYATGIRAVDGLDLRVNEGEFVVLVGPSGCGKTTALRMVAGLEEITSGTLRFGDRVVNHVSPRHRDVAMVFQNYALYPHMTVRQNIGFALENKKIPAAERDRRVRSAADVLGLTELLSRKPRQLSGGQRQRVAMGRAIVREPSVFLMDEPLSNLDAKLRVRMRSEVLRVHRSIGAATLYVTHDQTEAMTMGDRVAVLRDGVLQHGFFWKRVAVKIWGAVPKVAGERLFDDGVLAALERGHCELLMRDWRRAKIHDVDGIAESIEGLKRRHAGFLGEFFAARGRARRDAGDMDRYAVDAQQSAQMKAGCETRTDDYGIDRAGVRDPARQSSSAYLGHLRSPVATRPRVQYSRPDRRTQLAAQTLAGDVARTDYRAARRRNRRITVGIGVAALAANEACR